MLGNGVHGHGECQYVTGHDKDKIKHMSSKEDLSSKWTQDNFTGISNTGDVRMPQFELSQNISSVGSHDSQSNQNDDTWSNTEAGNRCWKRQYAQ
jgi:hypothetical protein